MTSKPFTFLVCDCNFFIYGKTYHQIGGCYENINEVLNVLEQIVRCFANEPYVQNCHLVLLHHNILSCVICYLRQNKKIKFDAEFIKKYNINTGKYKDILE
jgi:hypothetical protein